MFRQRGLERVVDGLQPDEVQRRPHGLGKPHPPFPPQPITEPGLESRMNPAPRYEAEAYRPAGKLQDKVALITGGDSGIGRAVVVIYTREGAHIALMYLEEEQSDAERTREAVEAHDREVQ